MNHADRLAEFLKEDAAFVVFRPENRRYLTGIGTSAGMVLLTRSERIFFTDFRYITMARAEIQNGFRVELASDSYGVLLKKFLPDTVRELYFEDGYVSYRMHQTLSELLGGRMQWCCGDSVLTELRSIKTPDEIERIRNAQNMTDAAFSRICDFLSDQLRRGPLTEQRIAAELDYAMKLSGSERAAFDTVVASGKNGAKPHAVPSEKPVQDGDLITMDFGAVFDGYCADMTRTVGFGAVSEHQREIYQITLDAQLAALSHLRSGMTGKQIDALARDVITARGYGPQFGHSLGHGVGLMIHEAPNFSPSYDLPISESAVVSVEPGIYLEDDCGVRIEDLVVVTSDGCEILTQSPKNLLIF